MRKILLVSLDVPPNASLASVRVTRFSRHLTDLGWSCRLLGSVPRRGYPTSDDLLKMIDADVPILRTRPFPTDRAFASLRKIMPNNMARFLVRQLAYTDTLFGWIPSAFLAMLDVIRDWHPDIVYFTAPSWNTFLLAYLLSATEQIPIGLDLRDPWYDDPEKELLNIPVWQDSLTRGIQHALFKQAKLITVTNPYFAEMLRERYHLPNVVCITGAFDFDPDAISPPPTGGPFTLSHLGQIYSTQSDIKPFIRGLEKAASEQSDANKRIMVNLIGPTFGTEYLQTHENIQLHGIIPRTRVPDVLGKSHALLVVYKGGLLRTNAKIFDYMASGRPVLAVMPQASGTTEYLVKSGIGKRVDPTDEDGIAAVIQELARAFEAGTQPSWFQPDLEYIRRFSARATVSQLAEALEAVAAGQFH